MSSDAYQLLKTDDNNHPQNALDWFNFSLNTRYAITSVLFNIAAVLMVQTSESHNGLSSTMTNEEISSTRIIILVATMWPLYHATHGWKLIPANDNATTSIRDDHNIDQTTLYRHKHPMAWYILSYSCSFMNLYNHLILNSIDDNHDAKTALFWILLNLDFGTTLASDIYLRQMSQSLNEGIIKHFVNDPTILLRLWKSCSGALKQAFFGNGNDSKAIILWATIVDSIGFSFTYYLFNSLASKQGKSAIKPPTLPNAVPLIFLVTSVSYVIMMLPDKDTAMSSHALAITALMALVIESITVSCMHPDTAQHKDSDRKSQSFFTITSTDVCNSDNGKAHNNHLTLSNSSSDV